jgi:serpin B
MAQESETITSSNAFSFELYKQLNKENENLFFSPISIDITLRMLYEGAESKTKSEFEKMLGISSASNNADEIKSKIDLMTSTNSSNRLNIANALWIDENFTVNDNYKGILSSKYNAELFPMDFSNRENSSNAINNWTAQKTNNLIQRIIEPSQISDDTKLILTNAIYFNGKWNNSFDKKLTTKAQFYSTQNNSFLIDFMRKAEALFYWENDAIQYVRKSFKGSDKYICFLLPKKKNGISELDSLLSKLDLRDIRSSARRENVNLAIPKFKMDNGYELKEPLSQLGLESAFTEHANFDGIAKEPLNIEKVLHKTHFEIDEEEVKAAAAATSILNMRIRGIPEEPKYIDFIADHPFVFLIIDNTTNTILFIGKFVNQEMKQEPLGNVDIASVSGYPGADLNKLSLRVKNKPLLVVDGIPYSPSTADLENLDLQNIHNLIHVSQEDIGSIDFFKDSATISKYGLAAANGVLSIKTKDGKTGK